MLQALIGPALSFGSSLISGLGARQSAKKQQKIQQAYEYQNYLMRENYNAQRAQLGNTIRNEAELLRVKWDPAGIARAADAAGFNPVTYANAFGGIYAQMQGYAEQMRFAGMEMTVNESYYQSAPTAQVPSTMEAVGGALQAGVNTYLADARALQSQAFQREMLQTQLQAIQRNGGRPLAVGNVPASQRTFFGSGNIPYAVTAGSITGGTKAPPPPGQGGYEGDAVKVTSPFASMGWYSWPRAPNTEDVGARYGEEGIVQALTGNVYIPYKDAQYNWNVWKHTGIDLGFIKIEPADRNQLGFYPDGARGLSWGRPNGAGTMHPEPVKPRNYIGWPGFNITW